MTRAWTRLKIAARFAGGLLAGVAGSGAIADWLFTMFEMLGVPVDPAAGGFGPLGWAALLATWTAAEFAAQTIAAIVARSVAVIWLVAAAHAVILIVAYYFQPYPVLLAGAPLGFLVAYRIRDSDLVRMGMASPDVRFPAFAGIGKRRSR